MPLDYPGRSFVSALGQPQATRQSTLHPILSGATRDPSLSERNVPDGILIYTDSMNNHITLIEFARTSDDTPSVALVVHARSSNTFLSAVPSCHYTRVPPFTSAPLS